MKVYVLDGASKIEDSAIQWGWSQMPAERVARLKKMTTSKGRMMHVAAFLLLSYGLKEHQIDRKGIMLAYKNGKPYLANRAIYFNISHSHDAIACGISKDECGVDIEKVRPVSDKLLKRVCSQEEREQIFSASNREEAFAEIWAMKESYIKLKGGSVITDLKKISDQIKEEQAMVHVLKQQGYGLCACSFQEKTAEKIIVTTQQIQSFCLKEAML